METNFKHTPGPWNISNKGAFIEHDGLPIAAVSMSSTEQLANAKLIAAAPELLDALDAMIEMYEAIELAGGWQGVYECAVYARKKVTE